MHHSPEAGSCILSVQSHGKPLAEHDGAGAFGLELAVGQGRSLGKLRPNTPSNIAPATADRFHDHRHESNALRLAFGGCVLVAALEVLVFRGSSIRVSGGKNFCEFITTNLPKPRFFSKSHPGLMGR